MKNFNKHKHLLNLFHDIRGEDVEEEREYVFHKDRDYEEISFCKVCTLKKFEVSSHFEGLVNGVWLCIYVFDATCWSPADIDRLPTVLHFYYYY